jgi:hypothetical protein
MNWGILVRCVAAVLLEAVASLPWGFYRPAYESHHPELIVVFLGAYLAAGLFLTKGMGRSGYLVCHCLMATAFIALAIQIRSDIARDPTSHNLFPFEFVGLVIVISPAYLGAALSRFFWPPVPPNFRRKRRRCGLFVYERSFPPS